MPLPPANDSTDVPGEDRPDVETGPGTPVTPERDVPNSGDVDTDRDVTDENA